MRRLLLMCVGLLSTYYVEAQAVATPNTSLVASAVRAASQRYRAAAPESRLVNGTAYASNVPSYVRGRPFFLSVDPQPGTIDFDGQHFANVELLYEQVQDQVLLYGPAQAAPVQLPRQKVQAFELAGHRFVHLPADSAGVLAEGFYDLVVDGPAQLLVKRTKKLDASTGGYELKGGYEDKTQFFLQRQGRFYAVNSLKQALVALDDQKPEMQAYARRNRLRFSTDRREASLVALAKQYNSLIRP